MNPLELVGAQERALSVVNPHWLFTRASWLSRNIYFQALNLLFRQMTMSPVSLRHYRSGNPGDGAPTFYVAHLRSKGILLVGTTFLICKKGMEMNF